MTRKEFVQYTVANTIGMYLHRYCSPHTIAQAQAKCVADAEKLADQVYSVIDARPEITEHQLPERTSPSLANRKRALPRVINVPAEPSPPKPREKDSDEDEGIGDMIDRLVGRGRSA